jgi:hypothetical protein
MGIPYWYVCQCTMIAGVTDKHCLDGLMGIPVGLFGFVRCIDGPHRVPDLTMIAVHIPRSSRVDKSYLY